MKILPFSLSLIRRWTHILTFLESITPIPTHVVCGDTPYWFTLRSGDETTSEWSPPPLRQALFYIITLCMQAWVWIMDESEAKQFNYPPSFCLTLLRSTHLINHGVNKHEDCWYPCSSWYIVTSPAEYTHPKLIQWHVQTTKERPTSGPDYYNHFTENYH